MFLSATLLKQKLTSPRALFCNIHQESPALVSPPRLENYKVDWLMLEP